MEFNNFNELFDNNTNKITFTDPYGVPGDAGCAARGVIALRRKFTSLSKPSVLVSILYKADTRSKEVKLLLVCGYRVSLTSVFQIDKHTNRIHVYDGFTNYITDDQLKHFIKNRLEDFNYIASNGINNKLANYQPKIIKSRRKYRRFNELNNYGKDFKFWMFYVNKKRLDPFLIERNFKGFKKFDQRYKKNS